MEGQLIASRFTCEALHSENSLGPLYKAQKEDGLPITLQAVPVQRLVPAEALPRAQKALSVAAGLHHPNLAGISELVPGEDGSFYLVRELLAGLLSLVVVALALQ